MLYKTFAIRKFSLSFTPLNSSNSTTAYLFQNIFAHFLPKTSSYAALAKAVKLAEPVSAAARKNKAIVSLAGSRPNDYQPLFLQPLNKVENQFFATYNEPSRCSQDDQCPDPSKVHIYLCDDSLFRQRKKRESIRSASFAKHALSFLFIQLDQGRMAILITCSVRCSNSLKASCTSLSDIRCVINERRSIFPFSISFTSFFM